MVLVPQETLNRLQSSTRLEQTPTTRAVHGLDEDMKQLLERQDITDDQKIKLYHQTLQRYMELNKQRMQPLTMTLQTQEIKSDKPPELKREHPLIEAPSQIKKIPPEEEDGYDMQRLFGEADHLPSSPIKRKRVSTRRRKTTPSKHKWSPY